MRFSFVVFYFILDLQNLLCDNGEDFKFDSIESSNQAPQQANPVEFGHSFRIQLITTIKDQTLLCNGFNQVFSSFSFASATRNYGWNLLVIWLSFLLHFCYAHQALLKCRLLFEPKTPNHILPFLPTFLISTFLNWINSLVKSCLELLLVHSIY